jgi:hypothetical protein
MSKDPLKLLLAITAGILIVIIFIWVINTYVVSAIFRPRIDSGNTTKVGDLPAQTKTDTSPPTNQLNPNPKATTTADSTPTIPNTTTPGVSEGKDAQKPVQKETQTPQAKTDRGSWEEQNSAYKI